MVYKVVKYGDPVLETPAAPVENFGTEELRQLVEDMFETMYASRGIGLAAPQIGISKRLAVVDTSAGEDTEMRRVLINPEITFREGKEVDEEGCLSIPGFRENVTRAKAIVVKGQDVFGNPVEIPAEDLMARAFQHEIDHLDGVLFLRHLSPLKRDVIRRKIRKLQQAGEWE
ncbi:MAG: peptide deformylase [Bryobacterales bacterium]|jgi:peptide deformylase|nr:peptide deformylase [Bryobacterales bacterium]